MKRLYDKYIKNHHLSKLSWFSLKAKEAIIGGRKGYVLLKRKTPFKCWEWCFRKHQGFLLLKISGHLRTTYRLQELRESCHLPGNACTIMLLFKSYCLQKHTPPPGKMICLSSCASPDQGLHSLLCEHLKGWTQWARCSLERDYQGFKAVGTVWAYAHSGAKFVHCRWQPDTSSLLPSDDNFL